MSNSTVKGRGAAVPAISRKEFNKLRSDVGKIKDRLRTEGDEDGAAGWVVGSHIRILTKSGSRAEGSLLWVGKYDVGLSLLSPLYHQNGRTPEFQTGDILTINKGDISILGPVGGGAGGSEQRDEPTL